MTYNREEIREKYRDFFEHSLDLIYINDLNGNFLDANDLTLIALGYEREDISNIKLLDLLEEDDLKKAYNILREIKKTGKQSKRVEYKVKAKDGNFIYIETYGIPLKRNRVIYAILSIGKNITIRKKAEQKLKDSEEMFRALYKEGPIATFTWKKVNNNFVLIDFNNTAENLTQGNVVTFLGHKASEMYKDRLDILEELHKCYNEKSRITREMIYTFQYSNEDKYLLVNYGYVKPDLVIVQTEDITEKRVAEEKLRESELRYRNLLDNLDVGFYQVTLDGRMLNHNQAHNIILGYDPSESLKDKDVTEFWQNPEDREYYLNYILKNNVTKNYICQALTKDGEKIVVELNSYLIRDEKGNPIRIDGTFSDITEKFNLERELRKSEEKYRNMIDSLDLGFYQLKLDGTLVNYNPTFCKLLGYNLSENLINKDVHDFWQKPEERRIYLKELEEKGFVKNYLVHAKKKNGEKIVLHLNSHIIERSKDKPILIQGLISDITEKFELEQKLKQSEEKYRILIEDIQDGVFLIQDEKMLFVNEAFAKMVGYTVEEIIGMKFQQLIAPEDLKMVAERYHRRQMGEDVPKEYEFRMLHKDGRTYVNINMSVGIITYKDKVASLGTSKDITEQKKVEQRIKQSEEMYRLISENANDLISIINTKMRIEYINEQVHSRVLGYTRDDLLGKNIIKLSHPNDQEKFLQEFKKAIETGRGFVEASIKHKDGHYIWTEMNGSVFKDKNGKIKVLLITRDISERKKAEKELTQSEEKFRRIFDAIPDLFFLVLKDTTILEYRGKEEILYRSPEETLGKRMINILPKNEALLFANAIKKTIETQQPNIFEYSLPIKGKIRDFEARNLFFSEERAAIFIREITERKKIENLIKEEIKKLKQIDQIRKDLISRASHELKTPLISICGGSELLLKLFKGKFEKDALELIEMIEKGGKRLKSLVDNLLDVTRIEYKKIELKKNLTNLYKIIRDSVKEVKYSLKMRDLILEFNLLDELFLKVDKIRIEQVILNLLSNAIKNTPPKGKVSIKLEKSDNWAVISIIDTGVGLTREEMEILFTRFGKIERYGNGLEYMDIQGSGLGLFISKEIVDLHGGNIRVESEGRNKGSTFIVKLPI